MKAAATQSSVQAQGIKHRISNDNLHISFQKGFETPQAHALIGLLERYHQSCKRIFVDVRHVAEPHPMAAAVFKDSFQHKPYAPQQIIFKGSTGFALAVNGNKVLVDSRKKGAAHPHKHEHGKDHVCCGKCANCRCGHKKTD